MFQRKQTLICYALFFVLVIFSSCSNYVPTFQDEIPENTFYFILNDGTNRYIMSEQNNTKKLSSIEAKLNNDNILVLSGTKPAFMTMTQEDDESYLFICNNKYLTCPKGGDGLSFEAEKSDFSYWFLEEIEGKEDTYYIRNKSALYNNNKSQYIEYYGGFTTYSFNNSKKEIYTVTIKPKKSLQFVNGSESSIDMHDSGIAYKIEKQNIDPSFDVTAAYSENNALLFGNPSRATKNELYAKNYLLERPQYTISFNNKSHNPNWVAWHLEASDMGDCARSDNFRTDTDLPASFYRVNDKQYNYSHYGFDRGHMCPSGARTSKKEDNSATFFMSNMVPQSGENNQKTWMNLEHYLQDIAKKGKEVYIISGPAGIGGSSSKGKYDYITLDPSWKLSRDDKGIVIPESTWKIALILDEGENDISRVKKDSTIIAVNIPNTINCHKDAIDNGFVKEYKVTYNDDGTRDEELLNPEDKFCWEYYATTVDQIEELTGFDFFANLDDEIENALESKKYQSR